MAIVSIRKLVCDILDNQSCGYFIKTQENANFSCFADSTSLILKSQFYIYPKSAIPQLGEMNRFETNIIKHLNRKDRYSLNFVNSQTMDRHWFFGQGFIIKEFLRVMDPADNKSLDFLYELYFYPHIDLARTSYLYQLNTACIPMKELKYYF